MLDIILNPECHLLLAALCHHVLFPRLSFIFTGFNSTKSLTWLQNAVSEAGPTLIVVSLETGHGDRVLVTKQAHTPCGFWVIPSKTFATAQHFSYSFIGCSLLFIREAILEQLKKLVLLLLLQHRLTFFLTETRVQRHRCVSVRPGAE